MVMDWMAKFSVIDILPLMKMELHFTPKYIQPLAFALVSFVLSLYAETRLERHKHAVVLTQFSIRYPLHVYLHKIFISFFTAAMGGSRTVHRIADT